MKILIGIVGLFILFEGTWLYQKKPLEQSIEDGKEIYADEYGLNRTEEGNLILPQSLVKVNTEENNNIPIPSFGFVIDF